MQPTRLRKVDWRCTNVLHEKAMQVATTDSEAIRQVLY
jgi:hypothetical protein